MAEIGDLDALLADLQQASAELETQIKLSPRNNNNNNSQVKHNIESPAVKINTNSLNYDTNTVVKRNFSQK